MKRKNFFMAILIAFCVQTSFAQETGVVINGVTWATRNVGAPGTFAAAPESSGMFYQWNRPTAWSTTGSVSGWDSSNSTGTTWETANDPSPAGWRVPTMEELAKLIDATKVDFAFTTENGINGGRFTDKTTGNSIFLPAVGGRNNSSGDIVSAGVYGMYSSSTFYDINFCYGFSFSNSIIPYSNIGAKASGRSVRPVKDGSTGINDISEDAVNATVIGYFDILGRKLTEEPTKGLYIIKYDNGKAKKVMR